MKLRKKILAYFIGKLIGKKSDYIIIAIEDKEIDNLILRKPYNLEVISYTIPLFATKEIIINLSKQINQNDVILDRLTYEAENSINC